MVEFSVTERESDRLKHALTLLSEAEKHLRVSTERSTWFTATLLQLGSMSSPDRTQSTSSRRQSSKATDEEHMSMVREANVPKQNSDARFAPQKPGSPSPFMVAAHCNSTSNEKPVRQIAKPNQSQFSDSGNLTGSNGDFATGQTMTCMDSKMLNNIWIQCIEKCHSKTLRQLLHAHGKLVCLSETKGKSRDHFKSMLKSFRCCKIRDKFLHAGGLIADIAFEDSNTKSRALGFLSSITNVFEFILRSNVEVRVSLLHDWRVRTSSADVSTSEDGKSDLPLRRIESIIHEQRLETAWMHAMEKGATASWKPERNQVLPQDGIDHPHVLNSKVQQWEDELHHEIKVLKINDQTVNKIGHHPISPSLLHNATTFPDNMGYESSSSAGGCSAFLCWNNRRPQGRRKGVQVQPKGGRRFSLIGESAKLRRSENKRLSI